LNKVFKLGNKLRSIKTEYINTTGTGKTFKYVESFLVTVITGRIKKKELITVKNAAILNDPPPVSINTKY
jgi:hypothetical protein